MDAIRAWVKLKPDDALIATMGMALLRQTSSEEWQRGVGIPYAATWLNQRRWEDTPKVSLTGGVASSTSTAARVVEEGVRYI